MRFDVETVRKHMQTFNRIFLRKPAYGQIVYLSLEDCEAIHVMVGFLSAGEQHGVEVFSQLGDESVFELMREGISNFGLNQPNLLEMVLSNTDLYEQTLEGGIGRLEKLLHIATYLLQEIVTKHPFLDGNKRTGFVTALVFLKLNALPMKGFRLKDAVDTLLEIAQGRRSNEQVYEWLRGYANLKP